jgi:hypothetical protein
VFDVFFLGRLAGVFSFFFVWHSLSCWTPNVIRS